MEIYDSLLGAVCDEYDRVTLIKKSERGEVTLIRHRASGNRYIFRHFSGSSEVYRKLLTVSCPNLPQIMEVGEKEGKTALLEELDKIPEGVFVIFCTTKLTKLLPELRSRAIDFTFGRINDQDADKLLNKLCVKNNYPMDDKVKRVLISNARGIPRKLTNLFDFVASGQYKSETIAQFLGVIDEEDFITLFDVMKLEDMFIFVNTVDGLLKENQADALIEQLKEFILRVIFLLEGNIADGFSQKETQQIREIFAGVNVTQLANYVTSLPTNCSEVDFKYALFKMRQTMQNRSIKQLVGSNSVVAVKQDIRATTVAKELEQTKKVEQNTNQLNGLNMAFMNNFGGN